jgi:predicted  nucleic acid-binding Zn-ribbon protein
MNEDPTKKLSDGESFEARVLSELSAIRGEQVEMRKAIAALDSRLGSVEERLTSLEEKVDARLRETRPIWESVLDNIKRLDLKFDEVLSELFEIKADSKRHERLILQLEKLR